MTNTVFDILTKCARITFMDCVPSVQDQIGWADLCLAEQERSLAKMLYQVAFVREGLSAQLQAKQASRAARAGLPQASGLPIRAVKSAGTIEIAVSDLRKIADTLSAQFAQGLTPATEPSPNTLPHVATLAHRAATVDPLSDIAAMIEQLYEFLYRPSSPAQIERAQVLITQLQIANWRVPEFDYRPYHVAPLPELGAAMAFSGLQDFINQHQDLFSPPFGSAETLNTLARLDSFGLGPYFANVPRLARRSRDIFELADIAVSASEEVGVDNVDVSLWTAFLSRGTKGPLLWEIIDDLGDRDERTALTLIFHREASKPIDQIDISFITRLRDTALDNLDYTLAGRAQALIVELRPNQVLEWLILGGIEGSAGRIGTAEQALLRCLELQPDNEDVTKRLFALRSRNFEPYVLTMGFDSPEDRRLNRLRRRLKCSTQGSPGYHSFDAVIPGCRIYPLMREFG
jgi:hypothetical protein